MEQQLLDIYTDPTNGSGAFRGIEPLYQECKRRGVEAVTRKKVENFLAKVNAYNLYRPVRQRFNRIPIYAHYVDQQWQADLAEMQSLAPANDGNRYILTVVDTLSKFAFAQPVKTKSASDVADAFKRVLSDAAPRRPTRLHTDKGKEFFNSVFKELMKNNEIQHFASESDTKAAGAERFNRTLKTLLYRYMRHKSSERWVDVLQQMVQSYNRAIHSRLKMAPENAVKARGDETKEAQMYHILYGRDAGKGPTKRKIAKNALKVGQMVRISSARGPFTKGYWGGWTLEHFYIARVITTNPNQVVYKLEDENREPVEGIFYRHQLQPITENTFYIEKVIKENKQNRQLFVKWLGWPKEFNSWINRDDIQNDRT